MGSEDPCNAVRRGRPLIDTPKESTTIRLDADIIERFRDGGPAGSRGSMRPCASGSIHTDKRSRTSGRRSLIQIREIARDPDRAYNLINDLVAGILARDGDGFLGERVISPMPRPGSSVPGRAA